MLRIVTVAQDNASLSELALRLTQLASNKDRKAFVSRHPILVQTKVVQDRAALVVKKIRLDPREALRIAEASVLIARKLGSAENVALAMREKANALYACGESGASVEHHRVAYEIYASRGSWLPHEALYFELVKPLHPRLSAQHLVFRSARKPAFSSVSCFANGRCLSRRSLHDLICPQRDGLCVPYPRVDQ